MAWIYVVLPESLKIPYKTLIYNAWKPILVIRKRLEPSLYDDGPLRINDVCWINPNDIIMYSLPQFLPVFRFKDRIVDGNWDECTRKFEDSNLFKLSYERFHDNKDWEEIAIYQETMKEWINGLSIWVSASKEGFDAHLNMIDNLYESIKKEGYKSQKQIAVKFRKFLIKEEVAVNIGRFGHILFNDGRHRLIVAKLLGIERMPVTITVRHPRWARFKNEILDYAKHHGGKVDAPLTHPDLQHIPSSYGHERFELIKNNLSIKKGALLDIGAHWGYFCHKFEDMGFECFAVETDPKNLYFLRKLWQAQKRQFRIVPEPIFSFCEKKKGFDVVLGLAVLHHFLRTEKEFLQLVKLFKTLDMKEMFFESYLPGEPELRGAFKNFSPDEFVEFILQNSCLVKSKLIGYTDNGRSLFKIYR